MDVQVDRDLIRLEREKRAWSQEHLAGAAGIGARTIQRIEATGIASYESVRAISAVLEIPVHMLRADEGSPRRGLGATAASSGGVAGTRSLGGPRFRLALRWLGAALALAMITGTGGFLLLKDYRQVRLLRTLEHWVTRQAEPPAGLANQSGGD